MIDTRLERLADMLVGYSTPVKSGDKVFILGGSSGAPLMLAIAKRVLLAGGHPVIYPTLPGYEQMFFTYASNDQLKYVHPFYQGFFETYDIRFKIISETNTKELSNIDPKKIATYRQGHSDLMKIFMERSAKKELRWNVCMFPTEAHAQDADMSLSEYEDFVYHACMPDPEDPIGYWKRISEKYWKVCQWLRGKDRVHIIGPDTDLQFSISGRTFENSDCHENVPDGEIFTGPVENSMSGHVHFSYPAIFTGREVSGVRLWFEHGKVVKASADKNEDFLIKTLDTDEGARYVGEFAIGTNEGIQRFTGELLFDEKIGGTFHLALGAGYPETGSVNESSVHWDMICDLRDGGEIVVDDQTIYRNGKFILDLD